MKPTFLAKGVGEIGCAMGRESEGLIILDVCWGRPMRRNSVLNGFRVWQFDDIQDEISEMADCRSEMTEGKLLEVNETKSYVSSAYSRWDMAEELMRVLSGVVYRLNRIGPRTDTWGTPHVREDKGERCSVSSQCISLLSRRNASLTIRWQRVPSKCGAKTKYIEFYRNMKNIDFDKLKSNIRSFAYMTLRCTRCGQMNRCVRQRSSASSRRSYVESNCS